MGVIFQGDIAQRLQLETGNRGQSIRGPLEYQFGNVQPIWSPADRYIRSALLIEQNTGGAGTIFTAQWSFEELLQLFQGQGNGIADLVAENPPRVWPKMLYLDYFFWTKTANPSGGTSWRTEVYCTISQDGTSIYTIPLMNESGTGLTGAVTDFWIREPKKPVPLPMPRNTDYFRRVSVLPSLNTDTYGIGTLFARIQTSDPLTNIASHGLVLTAHF